MSNLILNPGSNSGNTSGWLANNSAISVAPNNYFKMVVANGLQGTTTYAEARYGSVSVAAGTYYIEFDVYGEAQGGALRNDLYVRVGFYDNSTYQWATAAKQITAYPNGHVKETITLPAKSGFIVLRVGTTSAPDNMGYNALYFTNAWTDTQAYVPPVDEAPVVSAGPDRDVIVNTSITLNGSVTDDGLSAVTRSWTKISGPGTLTFGSPSSNSTTVTANAVGNYIVRFSATDAVGTVYDEMNLSVNEALTGGSNLILNPNSHSGNADGWTGAGVKPEGYFATSNQSAPATYALTVEPGQIYHYYVEGEVRDINGVRITTIPHSWELRIRNGAGSVYGGGSVEQGINASGDEVRSGTITVPLGVTQIYFEVKANSGSHYLWFKQAYVGEYVPDKTVTPTPPAPAPTGTWTGNVMLEVMEKPGPNANTLSNPHGADGTYPWLGHGSAAVTTSGSNEWTFINLGSLGGETYVTSEIFEVDASYLGIRFRWGGYSGDARVGVKIEYLDPSDVSLGFSAEEIANPAGGEYESVFSSQGAKAKVYLTLYRLTDVAWEGDFIEFREATVVQSNNLADVGNLEPWHADTSATWVNVIEPTHEISIEREAMDIGMLSATVLKEEYDPAIGGFIAPGRPVRVRVRTSNDVWESIYTGKIDNVRTEYPDGNTRIYLTATDNMTRLSHQKESRGVATVAELPFILEDKGVGWNINGNKNQVADAPTVSTNDSASVLDQILITRDSDEAYAWVDRFNVFNAVRRSDISTAPVVEFSDSPNSDPLYDSYSDIDVSFDTTSTINIVEVRYLRYYEAFDDQGVSEGWVTDEIKYGPYVRNDSIMDWGPYQSEFTIHGIVESEANMRDFASRVLIPNAIPKVKVNSLTMPVKNEKNRNHVAAVDLYSMVGVKYADKHDSDLRVTGITHEITPDLWTVEYSFESGDSVAVPLWTPSPNG